MEPPQPILLNIEKETLNNNNFRRVIYTDNYSQLAVMSLLPKQDIGEEVHTVDQFIRIEKGIGKAIINGYSVDISDGWIANIPAGNLHNIINTGNDSMKLYTIYSPPNEPPKTVEKYKPI